MEHYKKEKSSKQHLKIDLGPPDQTQEDVFTLVNPMTYGSPTTPTSPHTASTNSTSHTTPGPAPSASRGVSNPNTPTNAHHGGFIRSMERWSLKGKTKNQSIFKLFSRSQSGGMAGGGAVGVVSKDEEDGLEGSSGSDQEDPFSPNSSAAGELMQPNRQMSEPPKSPSNIIEQYATLPRQMRRHHSGGHSSRDSGFSSERESISHLKDELLSSGQTSNGDDVRVSPSELDDYKPAGMEALEVLHNQLQLLVKCDCEEDTDGTNVYEQVIAHLSKQLEDQSLALDSYKHGEASIKMSLRLAEQRALEAETELAHTKQRYLRVEKKYHNVVAKYKSLRGQLSEGEGVQLRQKRHSHTKSARPSSSHSASASLGHAHHHQQPHPPPPHSQPHPPHNISPQSSSDSSSCNRSPPQRVHSQTQYDRLSKLGGSHSGTATPTRRPNTAQGFNVEDDSMVASISSLSHTETSV